MTDVSRSKYDKLQSIEASKASVKRLFFFNITDGKSEFKAMEYQRIASLDYVKPGAKVRGVITNSNLLIHDCIL